MMLLIDPTSERVPQPRAIAPRLDRVAGRRIALLDISKPRGDVFLAELGRLLSERGASISNYRKPTFAKRLPVDMREEIMARNVAVIEALAD